MVLESKRRNNDNYNRKCDYISLRPLKTTGYAIRAAAKAEGESLQGYVLQAVLDRMTREGYPLMVNTPDDDVSSPK